MSKTLGTAPPLPTLPGIELRTFRGSTDIDGWLSLRVSAFAGLSAAGRPWTTADFNREFIAKPWWSPQRMWLATVAVGDSPSTKIVGAVNLGRSGRPPHDEPCVMWLMVDPQYRRRGIGRALLATIERSVWNGGERNVVLETHVTWLDAVRLYEQCGYRRRDGSAT